MIPHNLTMIPVRENSEVVIIYPEQSFNKHEATLKPPAIFHPIVRSFFMRRLTCFDPALRVMSRYIPSDGPKYGDFHDFHRGTPIAGWFFWGKILRWFLVVPLWLRNPPCSCKSLNNGFWASFPSTFGTVYRRSQIAPPFIYVCFATHGLNMAEYTNKKSLSV
jgi:hypothetical protein